MEEIILPLGDRVLIKVDKAESKSSGGILIPGSAQEKPLRGEVVGAGPECSVKEGDSVMYGKHSGTDIGNGMIMINEPQLLAVIEKK